MPNADGDKARIRGEIADFIVSNFLFGDAGKRPADGDSLIDAGIVDSTGILELIEFAESKYGISIDERETIPENLGSIANLADFIGRKKAS